MNKDVLTGEVLKAQKIALPALYTEIQALQEEVSYLREVLCSSVVSISLYPDKSWIKIIYSHGCCLDWSQAAKHYVKVCVEEGMLC